MSLSDNFVVFDYDELWDNFADDVCEIIPLSQRDVSVLMSALRVAHWQTRWFGGGLTLRELGRQADFEDAQDYIGALERKLLMTGCLDGLIAAIESLNDTVRLSSCCYEGGAGIQDIGGETYFGTEAPLEAPTAFGEGEEFESEEAYESHKCEVANGIVNALIATLNAFTLLDLFSLTAGAIAAGLFSLILLTVPPVALLVAIAITGVLTAGLYSLATEIGDNRAELVCILYNADTAVDAYDGFKDKLDEISVDLGFIEIQVSAISDLVMSMVPIDGMNNLFRSFSLPEIAGEQVDCSTECVVCSSYSVAYGTFDEETGYLTSELVEGTPDVHVAAMYFNYDDVEVDYCGPTVTLDITEISGTPNSPCTPVCGYRIYNQGSTILYQNADDPPGSPTSGVGHIYLRSTVPAEFTVELTWEDD